MLSSLQGYKDMYDDNSSQPQTWLAAAEVLSCLRLISQILHAH